MQEKQLNIWLKAVYHFHVFHYRMPQTASIAAITPFIPSPLTVKFAMVASLLQRGQYAEARKLAQILPKVSILVIPPGSAFSFKAFIRYRSVPAVESTGELDESGSFYPSRPHTREYALFQEDLMVFIGIPESLKELKEIVKSALKNIRYLGCKDSLTWCRNNVEEVAEPPFRLTIHPLSEGYPGGVVLLADIREDVSIIEMQDIIPGQRKESDYEQKPFTLPGRILTRGRTRLFIREDKQT